MSSGWGAYSTPPKTTNVATPLVEGTLPPFPENEVVVDETAKLTPTWRRWFAKQRIWLSDRGAYKPTDITLSGMGGAAAVFGNPVLQWWKQGNIIQIYLEMQFSSVTTGGGTVTVKPLPFDPSNRILQNGRLGYPLYVLAAMSYNGAVWTTVPTNASNTKALSTGTSIIATNIPTSTIYLHVNGTYITDN